MYREGFDKNALVPPAKQCEPTARLQQYQSDVLRLHARAAPVVQIVLQIAVTDAKLERRQELLVVHQVERVEHIEAEIFGRN